MTKQEFIERTNYTPTDEEFNSINEMYMDAGDMDKDMFCKEWLEHKDSVLLNKFFNQATGFHVQCDFYKELLKETAELLVRQAEECSEDEMYHQACKLIGQKAVVYYKIENDYELNKFDKEYIKNNLQ